MIGRERTISSMLRPGETLFEHRVLRQLGAGQFGTVFLARDERQPDRHAALKEVSADPASGLALDRFRREAWALAKLKPAHLVPIYRFEPLGDSWLIFQEYCPGGNAHDRLGQALPVEWLVQLANDIGAALAAIHEQGFIYGSLTPGNLLIDGASRFKLGDFGIAPVLPPPPRTPYASPEQLAGERFDARADLYSLGAILAELLLGRPLSGALPLAQSLPAERRRELGSLVPIVERLRAARPAARYPAAAALLNDLAEWRPGETQANGRTGTASAEPGGSKTPRDAAWWDKLLSYMVDRLERQAVQAVGLPPVGGRPTLVVNPLPRAPLMAGGESQVALIGGPGASGAKLQELRALLSEVLGRARGADRWYLGYPLVVRRPAGGPPTVMPVAYLAVEPRERAGAVDLLRLDDVPTFNGDLLLQADWEPEAASAMLDELAGPVPNSATLLERSQRLLAAAGLDATSEPLNPDRLGEGPPLAQLPDGTVTNRAALFRAPQDDLRAGLRRELEELRGRWPELGRTVLAPLLGLPIDRNAPQPLEIVGEPVWNLPLTPNPAQVSAVRQGLTGALTVVTGLPGAGKSAVVSSLAATMVVVGRPLLCAAATEPAIEALVRRAARPAAPSLYLRTGGAWREEVARTIAEVASARQPPAQQAQVRGQLSAARAAWQRAVGLQDAALAAADQRLALERRVAELHRQRAALRAALPPPVLAALTEAGDLTWPGSDTLSRLAQAVDEIDRVRSGRLVRVEKLWRTFDTVAPRRWALNEAATALQGWPPAIRTPLDRASEPTALTAADASLRTAVAALRWRETAEAWVEATIDLTTLPDLGRIRASFAHAATDIFPTSRALVDASRLAQTAGLSDGQRLKLHDYLAAMQRLTLDPPHGRAHQGLRERVDVLFQDVLVAFPAWALTPTGTSDLPLQPGLFDLVVFDEASQADLATALPLLFRARRAVLAGQPVLWPLRPPLDRAADQRLRARHGLAPADDGERSLFDWARQAEAAVVVDLGVHYRGAPELLALTALAQADGAQTASPRAHTHPDALFDLPAPLPAGLERPGRSRWLDVPGALEKTDGGLTNPVEAERVAGVVADLVDSLPEAASLAVLTPFRAQAALLRERLRDKLAQAVWISRRLVVGSPELLQGDERDAIVYSLTLSSGFDAKRLVGLDRQSAWLDAAVTRARSLFLVVGDLAYAQSVDAPRPLSALARRVIVPAIPGPAAPTPDPDPESPRGRLLAALRAAGLNVQPDLEVAGRLVDLVVRADRQVAVLVEDLAALRARSSRLADLAEDLHLERHGWNVLRLPEWQAQDDLETCLGRIKEAAEG